MQSGLLNRSVYSFESLVVLLREKPIIQTMSNILQRVHLLSTFRHGSPSKALTPENVNVKVFLAGYMIAYRPTHVFESMGALETALLEAATPLITTFQKICAVVKQGRGFQAVSPELTKDFPTMLFEYLKRFKAWKVPDEAKLTCRIKHALIALYQAEEHLPPDEPEDSKLKVEFRTQIERLRSKLLQIAGHNAVIEFDGQRSIGQPPSGGGSGGAGGAGGAYAALPGRMTNEQLAHELLLNPAFQLDESGGCGVENPVFHRIRESFHQAFWDSLVDDLRLERPCYVRVLRVLGEIRDGISDLAGSREQGGIAEVIDLDLIKQQAEAGLYGWRSCVKLLGEVVSIITRVQAPHRDEETKAQWAERHKELLAADADTQPRAFCKALEFLLDRVNAMRIDAANARLRLIAPVIKNHGIDYERGKFQGKLKDGSLTLERTKAWIHHAIQAAVATETVNMDELLEGKPAAYIRVHAKAMISLTTDPKAIKETTCPETLLFDIARINELRRELFEAAALSSLFITTAHAVTATKHPAASTLLQEVERVVTSKEHITEALEEVTGLIRTADWFPCKDTTIHSLERCVKEDDAVVRLLARRIEDAIQCIVCDGSADRLLAMPYMKSIGLFMPRVKKTAEKVVQLSSLNRVVHLPTYNKLIGESVLEIKQAS